MMTLATQLAPFLAQTQNTGGAAAGGFILLFGCCAFIFSLLFLGFWIWMLVDCCTRTFPGENEKLIWILIIVLTQVIGAVIYFFVGRSKGTKS